MVLAAALVRSLAAECGFELAGMAPAARLPDYDWFREWVQAGMAGSMGYLTDHRADLRESPQALLPGARTVICVGKLYNTKEPYSTQREDPSQPWISRYAWGQDYHDVLRPGLEQLRDRIEALAGVPFDSKICIDTAPLLERSYARQAGLGWIGKNTCLIHQGRGSWFFLGALILTLDGEFGAPPPDRCGTCTRCIDACPTAAIVPREAAGDEPRWMLDSRLCISYLTIERKGEIPASLREPLGTHVFGCDICQEVCPWNRRAPVTEDPAFAPSGAPDLEGFAAMPAEEFRARFRETPVWRARHGRFLRNVAVAMGNARDERFRPHLERLADGPDEIVASHAAWALERLG